MFDDGAFRSTPTSQLAVAEWRAAAGGRARGEARDLRQRSLTTAEADFRRAARPCRRTSNCSLPVRPGAAAAPGERTGSSEQADEARKARRLLARLRAAIRGQ